MTEVKKMSQCQRLALKYGYIIVHIGSDTSNFHLFDANHDRYVLTIENADHFPHPPDEIWDAACLDLRNNYFDDLDLEDRNLLAHLPIKMRRLDLIYKGQDSPVTYIDLESYKVSEGFLMIACKHDTYLIAVELIAKVRVY